MGAGAEAAALAVTSGWGGVFVRGAVLRIGLGESGAGERHVASHIIAAAPSITTDTRGESSRLGGFR